MNVEILIGSKVLKQPSFNFGKNKTGFLIILKEYTLEDKSEIEKAVIDKSSTIKFQEDDLILETNLNYYIFNLTDYKSYFTESNFFLGFSFQDKNGSLISEKINMFQVQSM